MLNKNILLKKYDELVVNFSDVARNIVFASDLKYSKYIGIAIQSILENNNELYFFHVFVNDISLSDLEKLKQLPYNNFNINIYWINDDTVKTLQTTQHFSIGMYYRLLVPYILDNKFKLFLYLDTDTLCIGSLSKIFEKDLSNDIAAVVEDTIENFHLETLYKLGFDKESKYFNSGVMYINSELWMKDKVTEKFLELINKDTYIYPDQDVLNIILHKKVKFIPEIFNYQRWLKIPREVFYQECKDVSIIHFIGPFKPWMISGYNKVYNKYKDISLWKKQPFEDINTVLGLKKASKYLWKDGNKALSIFYHIRYLIKKISGGK